MHLQTSIYFPEAYCGEDDVIDITLNLDEVDCEACLKQNKAWLKYLSAPKFVHPLDRRGRR